MVHAYATSQSILDMLPSLPSGSTRGTDPIDARTLALYGIKTPNLRLYQPLPPETAALRDLKTRRDQLLHMLLAETNRLEQARNARVRKSLSAHIASLKKEQKALDGEIAVHIRDSEILARKASLMRTLKGAGPAVASALLAHMPELGTLKKSEAASLAGLAPINNDSGKARGPRHIQAGRSSLRASLYMAALVAIRRNPVMQSFAANLKRNGKPSKVVIAAVMRKMIVTLNGMLKADRPWRHAQTA
jgi:transposase